MNLSAHFTLDEFCHSQTAARLGLDNVVPADLMPTAIRTAAYLEKIRTLLGDRPLLISSGYRSPSLNEKVGGSRLSQHMLAEAVDFTCPTYGTPGNIVNAIVKSGLDYDQVILEFGKWVHVSFSERNRKQALVIDVLGTRSFA